MIIESLFIIQNWHLPYTQCAKSWMNGILVFNFTPHYTGHTSNLHLIWNVQSCNRCYINEICCWTFANPNDLVNIKSDVLNKQYVQEISSCFSVGSCFIIMVINKKQKHYDTEYRDYFYNKTQILSFSNIFSFFFFAYMTYDILANACTQSQNTGCILGWYWYL